MGNLTPRWTDASADSIPDSLTIVNVIYWVIQILHLLIGIGAMALGQALATRIKQIHTPVQSR
jgi:hypothetical protein